MPMKDILSKLFIFAAGAGIGSAVTWKILKTKYDKVYEEEIAEAKEYYKELYKTPKQDEEAPAEEETVEETLTTVSYQKPDLKQYYNMILEQGYSAEEETNTDEEEAAIDRPYVISPEEFDEYGYDTISLTYYADGVLTDDGDEPIDDIDDIVGLESLNHFGEYEDDSVFVRNDRLKCDYEILLDPRKYYDIIKTEPLDEE